MIFKEVREGGELWRLYLYLPWPHGSWYWGKGGGVVRGIAVIVGMWKAGEEREAKPQMCDTKVNIGDSQFIHKVGCATVTQQVLQL